MGGLLDRSTSRFLACSKAAMTGIMGEGWESNPKCEVLYYGIDLSRFQTPVNREKIRQELGIAQNLQVIGHVGNFNLAKNHEFIVSLAEELSKVRKDVCFLLVGGGERRQYIEELVQSKGLHGQFIFTGSRPDVPQLMQAMDIFVLPSVREGLAIVLIEAQAAGLPLITSKLPAFEEVVFTPRHRALPFEIGRWVAACQEFLSQSNERKVSDRMWKDLERFSVEKCAQRLTEIYLSGF
jgi:glycosyltransferase involved in cell wall biosynthesis